MQKRCIDAVLWKGKKIPPTKIVVASVCLSVCPTQAAHWLQIWKHPEKTIFHQYCFARWWRRYSTDMVAGLAGRGVPAHRGPWVMPWAIRSPEAYGPSRFLILYVTSRGVWREESGQWGAWSGRPEGGIGRGRAVVPITWQWPSRGRGKGQGAHGVGVRVN